VAPVEKVDDAQTRAAVADDRAMPQRQLSIRGCIWTMKGEGRAQFRRVFLCPNLDWFVITPGELFVWPKKTGPSWARLGPFWGVLFG
jgi:hypothetical protein